MAFYLILTSTGLLCFWLYYFVVLRRTTFFNLNRWYLFGALIFCLLVPFTHLFIDFSDATVLKGESSVARLPYASEMLNTVEVIQSKIQVVQQASTTKIPWLSTLYFIVCGIFLLRFVWSVASIRRLTRCSKELPSKGCKVYRTELIDQPFSLFNRVFMPKKWDNIPHEILYHEQEHVKRLHFIDVILMELAIILLWFNPIIYLYKRSLRLNLEYLADRAVLSQCPDPLKYQSLLISNALESSIKSPITTHFATPLKNRITMMKKTKTQNWMRIAVLGTIPLAVGLTAMNTHSELRTPLKASFAPIVAVIEANNTPAGSPLAEGKLLKISSEFGMKMHPILKVEKLHTGIDLVAKEGTPVFATADGEVVISKMDKDRGNYIQIKHSDSYETQYSHMSKNVAAEGDQIKKGQLIGYVGNTGASTGPHLHYEIHENGKPVDPAKFMK